MEYGALIFAISLVIGFYLGIALCKRDLWGGWRKDG